MKELGPCTLAEVVKSFTKCTYCYDADGNRYPNKPCICRDDFELAIVDALTEMATSTSKE